MKDNQQKIKPARDKRGPYKEDVLNHFVSWSVMTKKERQKAGIGTAKAFAEKYGISEGHLSRWKQSQDYRNHKEERQRSKLQDLTPDVLEAFYKRCLRYGMSSDIELWLALVERWDKKKVIEQKQEIQFGMNDVRTLTQHLSPEKKKYYHVTLARLLADAVQAEQKVKSEALNL